MFKSLPLCISIRKYVIDVVNVVLMVVNHFAIVTEVFDMQVTEVSSFFLIILTQKDEFLKWS